MLNQKDDCIESITIPYGNHVDYDECLWFLNRNFDDCLHVIHEKGIRKAIKFNNDLLLLEITGDIGCLRATVLVGNVTENIKRQIIEFITEWFDLARDLTPFYKLLEGHRILAYMSKEYYGLRLVGIPDLFEALAWSIIGQQINLSFAYKLKRRLVEQYGDFISYGNTRYYIFPDYSTLAKAKLADLKDMQFSSRKGEYLIELASTFDNNILSKDFLLGLPDMMVRQKVLTDLRGIGIWTANYTLMKCLREPSSIPYGDAGLLNALVNHQIIKEKGDLKKIEHFFTQFVGWESYVVFYLWRSLAIKNN
ncbi:DNA-3-methyladenine glycosylase family protein [Olivibacter domesticus]|uniref:DNA-3-methyladenine glycosylase II n=1 Tax=Olivibacter domesticus TaxID=407022 RepID=A0A1H7IWN2_OLID1|nr:DNA glycosylase [Olivibacter domesticus]SEK66788.1 DNA-3-methyladenine glycosylase II [Olivibacter domesticus]